ncbi:MAG TPA: glycine--tRNA ligase, partial [Candidatus Polarisedimenticolaceae bacterium]|nr:glycine--tRNA ligase [Candidatus Polarisedimenticolaceae bacterium]
DHLLEDNGVDNAAELTVEELEAKIIELGLKSPEGNPLTKVKLFNMMFQTQVGPIDDTSSKTYLRPETAQGMFVNFKNVLDTLHPKLPFGLAQIGKNFRNEITPRDFIFRVRELEIMEFEYFIREGEWEKRYEELRQEMLRWFERVGLDKGDIHEKEVPEADRAHYSKRTVDFYFNFPHKRDEIGGLAYRTDFDLSNHTKQSGVDLTYMDPETNERFIPHVIEPTFGLDRHVLAVLTAAYSVESVGDSVRTVLHLKPALAPVKVAVSPLLRNKPELVKVAREVYGDLKKTFGAVMYDDNGNIGKRYRRQDEIGTPLCVTIDFDSLEDKQVTVRHRDSLAQVRVPIAELANHISHQLTEF